MRLRRISAIGLHIQKNIRFSLCYRLVRICSEPETLHKRLQELKNLLLSRNYRPKSVNDAIEKAKKIPREEALKRVVKKKTDRVVFALDFNPCLPSMSRILQSAWRVMSQDPYMREVFPEPPMAALRCTTTIRDKIVKAKIPEPPRQRPSRTVPGMKKCNKPQCRTCPFVATGSEVKCEVTGEKHKINSPSECQTTNVIYCISCVKCKQQYIGETERTLDARFREHLGYVRNKKLQEPTGSHFNLPRHDISMMKISVLEKIWNPSKSLRKTRESMFIRRFETKYKGMNRKIQYLLFCYYFVTSFQNLVFFSFTQHAKIYFIFTKKH